MEHNSRLSDTYIPSQNNLRQHGCTIEEIKLLSLNVCGLKSRLKTPEFHELISSYDIIGVQETKLDDADSIEIPGYSSVCQNRRKLSRYRSGGTAVIVKDSLSQYITHENSNSKLVQWFSISRLLTNTDEDIHCGVVYIPPARSRYSSPDPYLEIQNEIDQHCGNCDNIIIFGDFNSRTGKRPDFVIVDQFISDEYDNGILYNESMYTLQCMLKSNATLERDSADLTTNAYGLQLLEFCKSNELYILNGRLGQDSVKPSVTCKDRSTVDYFIASPKLLESLIDLSVLDFSSLFSDAHCGVTLTIKTKHQLPSQNPTSAKEDPKVKLWEQGKAEIYLQNINLDVVTGINENLEEISKRGDISESDINDVVNKIETLFQDSCKRTFGYNKPKPKQKVSNKKQFTWFNLECKNARNLYHRSRRLYNKHKTEYYKQLLKTISKDYKRVMNKNKKRSDQTRIDNLRNLKSTNAKDYWRILNNGKQKQPEAPLNDLYEHFKNVNNPNGMQENEDTPIIDVENSTINEEINKPITENEIIKAVMLLKNNKSPGIDEIRNEHIKTTLPQLLPTYHKLFNIIFDKGIIPESWLIGNILPIYKNKGEVQNPENYRPITLLSCLGKLFTTIINNRLNKVAEEANLLTDTQAVFRKGFSTIDNIFIINSLIEIFKSSHKKLYCAFIDFKQAFDTVWRDGLWQKLSAYHINGKCLNLIQNLYKNIKSRVSTSEGSSAFFPCNTGVRQGESLSPFLFSIFLNDLDHYFRIRNHGVLVLS